MQAVEAIMREIAKELNEDVEKWGLAGLLHDVDFEQTKDEPAMHGMVGAKMLQGKVDAEVLRAMRSHNFENTQVLPKTLMEKCLVAADTISGLIIAAALIMPSKRLGEVKVETIKKKFKQKDFARTCSRGRILFCEKARIEKEKFFEIALRALQSISEKLRL